MRSERLQRLVERATFKRQEMNIRHQIADALRVSHDDIAFSNWKSHESLVEALRKRQAEVEQGERAWLRYEWEQSQQQEFTQFIKAVGEQIGHRRGWLYLPRYSAFTPYKGWQSCPVPPIAVKDITGLLEKAMQLLQLVDGFVVVLDEDADDFIGIDESRSYWEGKGILTTYTLLAVGERVVANIQSLPPPVAWAHREGTIFSRE